MGITVVWSTVGDERMMEVAIKMENLAHDSLSLNACSPAPRGLSANAAG